MIQYSDIKSLQKRAIYPTSNEKYVLNKRSEKIIRSPEYKILGFLHNFLFSYDHSYISKSTLDGVTVLKRYIGDIDYASFHENVDFMYVYGNKTFYKVTEDLNIEWSIDTDDYIRSITIDGCGNAFVVYENSRIIHEYLPSGERLQSFRDSDDVTHKTRIFKTFVNKGRTEMYAIGTIFVKVDAPYIQSVKDVVILNENNKAITDKDNNPIIISVINNEPNKDYMAEYAETFIDKYNLVTGTRESHNIVCKDYGVRSDDPYYNYDNIYVNNNDIYIYSNEYIQKINKSMISVWKRYLGYNESTKRYNQLGHIEYDDNDFNNHLYFTEDLYETNGHAFGKLNTNGDLIWKIAFDKSISNVLFSFAAYNGDVFTSHKSLINLVDSYNLAVNDYNMVFRTKNGHLIKVIRNNEDEIYSDEYYTPFQLLADVIKGEIPEYIDQEVWVRGNQPLINESNDPILVTQPNPNYTDISNFDVFKLKGVEIRDTPYPNALISTKQGNALLTTKFGEHVFSTLNPLVYPDQIEGNYEYPFDLYGDTHIFKNSIITKKKGLRLITKKTNSYIIKKSKNFYKFIYRRFSDVDIVLEFIKQSGVLETALPKFANKLIHHTTHMIQDMQEAHIPVQYDLKAEKMFSYWYDSIEYPIRQLKTQVYLCHNIPYMRKQETESIFMDSMANLVNNSIIKPFIMFIDGKAIKWSNMTIVRNWEYSYIIISNIDHDISYKYVVDAILLPCLVRYGEDDNIAPLDYERFLFDEKGMYTDAPSPNGMRIEIIDPKISGNTYRYNIGTDYIQIETNYDQISSDKNILIFENNKFHKENIDYLEDHGHNIYTYNKNVNATIKTFYYMKANSSKNHLIKIPHYTQVDKDIKENIVDNNENNYLINFKDQFDYSYDKKYSYNENVSRAIEYIMSYDMSLLNKYYEDKSNIKCYCFTGKDILDRLKDGYIEMPRDRKYGLDDYVVVFKNGRVFDRYREIEYKANMFKIPIGTSLTENDTLEIVHYKWIDNRYYTVKMTHMSETEQELLKTMPAIDIARMNFARMYEQSWYDERTDEQGEVLYDYKNYMANHLRHGNLTIWGNNKSGSEIYDDEILEDNYIQYPVQFEYKNCYDEDGLYENTEIIIKDRYYKYRNLNLTSSRQFHSMYYNVLENEKDTFDLDQSFRFSQNKKQYMIFVNGKKLNFNEFDLLIPRMDTYTVYTIRALVDYNGNTILINDKPMSIYDSSQSEVVTETNRMAIKTTTPLHLGDIIEILYLPDPYDEIILRNYIPNENGIIELDKDIIQYPFSKDLFLVFMNGKKVSNDLIENITMNKIRIKSISNDDIINMDNITICKYIIPDKILKELYSYGDQWSDGVDKLSDADFKKLFVDLKNLV